MPNPNELKWYLRMLYQLNQQCHFSKTSLQLMDIHVFWYLTILPHSLQTCCNESRNIQKIAPKDSFTNGLANCNLKMCLYANETAPLHLKIQWILFWYRAPPLAFVTSRKSLILVSIFTCSFSKGKELKVCVWIGQTNIWEFVNIA